MQTKIDLTLPDIDVSRLKGKCVFAAGKFSEFEILDTEYLTELLNDRIIFNIEPARYNITEIMYPGSHPHTDYWTAGLNYYINVGDDITSWWTHTPGQDDESYVMSGVWKPRLYKFEDLTLKEEFKANKGDCYLLNTHEIHSVEVSTTPRIILRFLWANHSYDTINNSIIIPKSTGC